MTTIESKVYNSWTDICVAKVRSFLCCGPGTESKLKLINCFPSIESLTNNANNYNIYMYGVYVSSLIMPS